MILLQGHRLCFLLYSVAAVSTKEKELRAYVNVALPGTLGIGEPFSYEVHNSLVRGIYDSMEVWITPDYATRLEREHAFDFDLSCLTSFLGCRAVCKLMPSAWLDYQKEAREKGWPLMPDELNDPRCKKLAVSQ